MKIFSAFLLFFSHFSQICHAFFAPSHSQKIKFDKDVVSLASSYQNEDAVTGVTLKIAFDSQWGVADLSEEKSERFTCADSLDMVHRLRRCSDAVLVGRSTLQADNCTLTVRRVPLFDSQEQPTRVIIDPNLSLNLENYALAKDGIKTLIVHSHRTKQQTKRKEFDSITFVGIPPIEGTNIISAADVSEVLAQEHGIHHLMVEGGPRTARQFLEEGQVDRAIVVRAPLSFKEPLPSNMSPSTFQEAGLELIASSMNDVDTVDYWCRPDLSWPSDPPDSWP